MFWAGDFVAAKIAGDTYLQSVIGDRLFAVARDNVSEEEDMLPYIIMQPQAFSDSSTKDGIEGRDVSFDLLVCSESYASESLPSYGKIVEALHRVFVEDTEYPLISGDTEVHYCDFAVKPVAYDPDKPCFFGYVSLTFSTYKN